MRKILSYIYKDMADFEVTLALNLLGFSGEFEIILIAENKEVVKGKGGISYMPDKTVKEALELNDVDALIIPGGSNDEQSNELTELINKLDSQNKLLAAICRGPSYLARAGVLKTAKYTTTYSIDVVKKLEVEDPFNRENFVKENVVRDGHIITALGNAFVDFAMEILNFFDMFDDDEDKIECTAHWKCLD